MFKGIQLLDPVVLMTSGVPAPTAFDVDISDNDDDGEDTQFTWAVTIARVGNVSFASRDAGFLFQLSIASGKTIVDATLELNVTGVNTSGGIAKLHAWDTNDPADFDSTNRPSTVTLTTAFVARTLGTIQLESFDVKTIIQELIDGNGGTTSIAFCLMDNGSPAIPANNSRIEDLIDAAGTEARLHGSYS